MDSEPVAPVAWLFVLATGAVSTVYALVVLSSAELDEASPIPWYQRAIAIAGIVAAALAVALLLYEGGTGFFVVVVVLIGLFCVLPLWHTPGTVDVTATGFPRAAYRGEWSDLYVYNATDAPVTVNIGDGARFPARQRVLAPHRRAAVKWPVDVYGTFTLAITTPVAPGARASASVRRDEPERRPTV